jgi:hypothetical protein
LRMPLPILERAWYGCPPNLAELAVFFGFQP